MRSAEDYAATERLETGDPCEFRYPAREEWQPGIVIHNGGSGFWSVRDLSDSEGKFGVTTHALYIEHVRALDSSTAEACLRTLGARISNPSDPSSPGKRRLVVEVPADFDGDLARAADLGQVTFLGPLGSLTSDADGGVPR